MVQGHYSSEGFEVTANNAVDFIAGTQAASAGMISANIRRLGRDLHADFGSVERTLRSQAQQVGQVNAQGYARLESAIAHDTAATREGLTQVQSSIAAQTDSVVGELDELQADASDLQALSAASVAVQAVGFAVAIRQISKLREDVQSVHGELTRRGQELVEIQRVTQGHLQSLVDYTARTLATQAEILATLVHSRTSEAQQLIRQGWENLQGGFEADAHARFIKSLEYDNTVYLPHAELARHYEKAGDMQAAELHHRRALAFADRGGLNMKPFALVQYAGFLDQQNRRSEAIAQVREALSLAEKQTGSDQPTLLAKEIPAWQYYLAELLASSGDDAPAMEMLRRCVSSAPLFFVAAMASPALLKCQSALMQTLMGVDSSKRLEVIQNLAKVKIAIETLEKLGKPAQSALLRKQAATRFEALLTAEHANLAGFLTESQKLWHEAVLALTDAANGAERELVALAAVLKSQLGPRPAQNPPMNFQADQISTRQTLDFFFACSTLLTFVLALLQESYFWMGIVLAASLLVMREKSNSQRLRDWQTAYLASVKAWNGKLNELREHFALKQAQAIEALQSSPVIAQLSAVNEHVQRLAALNPFAEF